MSEQRDSTNHSVVPSQVWLNLTTDLKVKVIWLLSQLAFNLVITQLEQSRKEVSDANTSAKQY
ncbi:MAG: hypothetical protein AB1489_35265 [Acidobacteriota bacterium]